MSEERRSGLSVPFGTAAQLGRLNAMNDLRRLLVHDLEEMLGADRLLLAAWPRLKRAATAPPLRKFCQEGIDYTQERIARLEAAFEVLGERPRRLPAPAMRALIRDAVSAARMNPPALRDVAILGAVQRISHHGRAGYGTMAAYARRLGEGQAAKRLHESYKEKDDATKEMVAMFARTLLPRLRK
jgi:ferritin-like metal-binding protein YciE